MRTTQGHDGEASDLRRAAAGDHDAFMRVVTPYRTELHRHCYRMTGSIDDADDILQETLFRAWRSLGTYAGRSSFRAWLYRIATNRSIDALGGRARREIAVAWDGQAEGLEPMWLQPYPDSNPGEVNERREHIATAFVAAIQRLAPKQRAALLLKGRLGLLRGRHSRVVGHHRTRSQLRAATGPIDDWEPDPKPTRLGSGNSAARPAHGCMATSRPRRPDPSVGHRYRADNAARPRPLRWGLRHPYHAGLRCTGRQSSPHAAPAHDRQPAASHGAVPAGRGGRARAGDLHLADLEAPDAGLARIMSTLNTLRCGPPTSGALRPG